jgi:broad specificity phosphatase PhoE
MAGRIMIARYLTHPEVVIDPSVPVKSWGLNDVGQARIAALIASDALMGTGLVISSDEQKAIDAAKPISTAIDARWEIRPDTHENDRTATGFLPGPEFEATADAFFAEPDTSVRGWETARAAQARIVREVEAVLSAHKSKDVLFVGHGGVGTLLYCHLAGEKISRSFDQMPGGGCYFTFEIETRAPRHHWRPIEALSS